MKGLKFIGRGSAFNTEEGNTSAYIKRNKTLLLLDCGENIFTKIKESNLLDGVDKVYVAITHLHSDHAGSLGTLIAYCYYIKSIPVHVLYQEIGKLKDYLDLCIVDEKVYTMQSMLEVNTIEINNMKISIKSKCVNHIDIKPSFCFTIIDHEEKCVYYYSGDANQFVFDKRLEVEKMKFDYMIYQDTCLADYPGNVHLSLNKLCQSVVDMNIRKHIYCMHLDSPELESKVIENGFNVVKLDEKEDFDYTLSISEMNTSYDSKLQILNKKFDILKNDINKNISNDNTLIQRIGKDGIFELVKDKLNDFFNYMKDQGIILSYNLSDSDRVPYIDCNKNIYYKYYIKTSLSNEDMCENKYIYEIFFMTGDR